MKFSNCLKLAMVVGMAATAASAGDRIALQPITGVTPVFKGWVDINTGEVSQYGTRQLSTSAYDNMGDFADGTPGVVSAVDGSAADYFFLGLVADAGDYLTLDRNFGGRGVFGDSVVGYVDSLSWGISYLGAGADTPVDDYHLFYDDLVTWDSGATLTDITRGSLEGGFYFADLPAPDINSCGCFYGYGTTGIAAALPIAIDDNFLTYRHIVSVTGSGGFPVADPNGLTAYNGDGSASGTDGDNYLGASIDLFLIDGDGSGEFNGNEWLYYYGGTPTVANLMVNIGVFACDADFDGSGFVDLDDFSGFVAAFENGC